MGSEQVAMVLRQSGSHVRLIVARPVEPTSPSYHALHSSAPIVPTRLLSDPEEIERHLTMFQQTSQNGFAPQYNGPDFSVFNQTPVPLESVQLDLHVEQSTPPTEPEKSYSHQFYPQLQQVPEEEDLSEMDIIDIQLIKDQQGLGITIAGYVCEKEEISGIFVKSITKGSAADMCGKLQVNDHIIEVDGRSLQGFTNHQAVEVLRNTGKVVKLRLARYLRGTKYEQLQQAVSTGEFYVPATTQAQIHEPKIITSSSVGGIQETYQKDTLHTTNNNYVAGFDNETEVAIQEKWKKLLGLNYTIVVAQISKFKENGGLGISLEGTVDVEDGREVRPHHYIGSILTNGPVGRNGKLCCGDELLEVNGKRLLGLNHKEVVQILKELPKYVCLVCARYSYPSTKDFCMSPMFHSTPKRTCNQCFKSCKSKASSTRLVKAKSDGYLLMGLSFVSSVHTTLSRLKSRSLEPLTSLATWSSEPQIVDLIKGDRGLGFSVLDYQDPMNPNETVIVIRSLVPGGAAQQDGRLIPGDRLLFVNDISLENASLDTAVHILQRAPKGIVRIGIAKPLPCPESNHNTQISFENSESKEFLTENYPKSTVCTPSSFDADQRFDQVNRTVYTPVYQPSLTPSSLISGYFDSSTSTPLSSSPAFSPVVTGLDISPLPAALERITRIKKGSDKLGLSVELVEKGVNGMLVKSIAPNSALEKDGSIVVGDYVLSVNNESMRKITKSQARAILKRAELLSTDITIKYVPGPDAAVHHQSVLMALQQGRESPASIILPRQLSPRIFPKYYRSPFFHSRVHEDTTNGELSDDSILKSLPLSEYPENLGQILSPYTATSEGMSTIPTPSSFSTDFSELKHSENMTPSEEDEEKDSMTEDISQEQTTEEKSTEKTTSLSFAELRAVFADKSAPSKPVVPFKLIQKSSPSQPSDDIINYSSQKDTFVSTILNAVGSSVDSIEKSSISPADSQGLSSHSQWGSEKIVEVSRGSDSSLGISIVRGAAYKDEDSSDSVYSGIFIKNVIENSPAGQTGAIQKGDKILQVNDVDLNSITYEKAVEIIRNAESPVKFVLQSPLEMGSMKRSPELQITQAEKWEEEISPAGPLRSGSLPVITNPTLLSPSQLSDRIEILSTSVGESEEEDVVEEETFKRGKTYNKRGTEVDRASAVNIKLSVEDLPDEEEDEFGYTMNLNI